MNDSKLHKSFYERLTQTQFKHFANDLHKFVRGKFLEIVSGKDIHPFWTQIPMIGFTNELLKFVQLNLVIACFKGFT